jgi:hypothetical protein
MKTIFDWYAETHPHALLKAVDVRSPARRRLARMAAAGVYRLVAPFHGWTVILADMTDDGRYWSGDDWAPVIKWANATFGRGWSNVTDRGGYLVHTVDDLRYSLFSLGSETFTVSDHFATADSPPELLAKMCPVLRDVFPPPARLSGHGHHTTVKQFAPWRTDTVLTLARQMWQDREFSAMPILADALQDAGCDRADVLSHCRDAGQPHCRGCWVLDVILGLKGN